MAKVLAISSHVARGHVGLAATVPALQRLGHEVWALPTVLLASRPGMGRLARTEMPPADLAAMLATLEADGCWAALDAVLTGYFPSPQSVAAAAAAVRSIKDAAPAIPVLVDPIVGDAGRLYVAEATAAAIRDQLLPLATIATPNRFELAWLRGGLGVGLSGDAAAGLADVVSAARRLGPETVVVTSAAETEGSISTLLVTADRTVARLSARHDHIPNGAGDLLAGLFLGHSLTGLELEAVLDSTLADLDRVLAASAGRDVLELSALAGAPPDRGR
jgi:pyridoxine kinase